MSLLYKKTFRIVFSPTQLNLSRLPYLKYPPNKKRRVYASFKKTKQEIVNLLDTEILRLQQLREQFNQLEDLALWRNFETQENMDFSSLEAKKGIP